MKTSVVIPSRQPEYLNKTISDLFEKGNDLEVIVVLDGYWTQVDERARVIHFGTHKGMRDAINAGMQIARGEYVMKLDEHCMVDKDFDLKLIEDCEDDWVVVPRRKRLDADKWELIEDGRRDVDYMYVEYPFLKPYDKTQGLHGAIWDRPERDDVLIDDNPTMQGSCYFMKKKTWDKFFPKGLETDKYGPFTQEAQEISFAVWLSGGRFVVNKKTWYAHYHKGRNGKGYGFSTAEYKKHCEWNERGRVYCINHWLNTKDYKYDFEWFVNKFPNMPKWPDNWKERIEEDRKKDYSTLKYEDDFWLSNLKGQTLDSR